MTAEIPISVNVDLDSFIGLLDEMIDGLEQMDAEPMATASREVADAVMMAYRERFYIQSQGGGAWAPNTPATVREWFTRNGGATLSADAGQKSILVDKGNLADSLRRDSSEYYEVPNEDGIEFGTTNFTAIFHQDGTSRMVARPIIVLIEDPTMPQGVSDSIADALIGGLQKIVDGAASVSPQPIQSEATLVSV